MRSLIRFRDATLVDKKKDDFGGTLQNLYRKLERDGGVISNFSVCLLL